MSLHSVVGRGLALICRLRPAQQECVDSVVVEFVAARFRFACAPSTVSQALRTRIRFPSVMCIVRRGYCHRTSNRGCQLADLLRVPTDKLAFARFLRHSVHAFGVTTPSPRRLLELTDPSIAVLHDRVYCWKPLAEEHHMLFARAMALEQQRSGVS